MSMLLKFSSVNNACAGRSGIANCLNWDLLDEWIGGILALHLSCRGTRHLYSLQCLRYSNFLLLTMLVRDVALLQSSELGFIG